MTLSTLTPAAPPLAPPFEVETDPHRQAALDWVNHVREKLGRDPLSDLRPADSEYGTGPYPLSSHCPIAASVREGREFVWHSGGTTVDHKVFGGTPMAANLFVSKFDNGAYPDLRAGVS